MRAVEISQPGGPEVLKPVDAPGAGAEGERDPDQGRRRGRQPPGRAAAQRPLPGAARRVGPAGARGRGRSGCARVLQQESMETGDKVCALVHGGGYAEYCAAPEVTRRCRCRRAWSLAEAASLPETFFTVWGNVYDRGRLAPGESLLVQGGTSGIGVTRDPDGHGDRQPRVRHRRLGREGAPPACASAPRRRSTTRRRTSPPKCKRRHRRQGRQRDPRHGRRRLRAEGAEVPRRRRPAGVHRLPARPRRPSSTSTRSCAGASRSPARRCVRGRSSSRAPSRKQPAREDLAAHRGGQDQARRSTGPSRSARPPRPIA